MRKIETYQTESSGRNIFELEEITERFKKQNKMQKIEIDQTESSDKNTFERAVVIKEELENSIDALFAVCHKRCGSKSGDISPIQVMILEGIKKNLQALIEEQITQNIDYDTDSSN